MPLIIQLLKEMMKIMNFKIVKKIRPMRYLRISPFVII